MKRATDVRLRLIIHPTWFHQICEVPVTVRVSVCCVCQCQVKDGRAFGEPVPQRPGQSHTWCYDCIPQWFGKAGLNQEQIAELQQVAIGAKEAA